MKQSFTTSVGLVEVLLDEESRTVSAYRFDANRRPIAAAIESWDYADLPDLLTRQTGVPDWEASYIASSVDAWVERERKSSVENAGVLLRFVAVLLDAVIVFVPAGIIVSLLSDGGQALWLLLALGLGYYVFCEAATGATLGKLIVGIQVIGEDGEDLTFGAAVVRNLLRLVDGLFFYVVGGIFALTSPHGQRLGDRAAHTLVVRR